MGREIQYSNKWQKINDDEFIEIVEAIELIKEETNLKVCCSLGLLDREKLKELKNWTLGFTIT